MAEKEPLIVIKKINVVAGGAHGGAWKVAFADFMTAMMAFFLVMWLLATSSPEAKQNVADYFSTPSVIEYNFSNYGVEITLEKLFLDLINEPLRTLQAFMDPMDRTPNVMGMGMKKVIVAFLADQLGDVASEVEVNRDNIVFEIPDTFLFERASSKPAAQFMTIMEKINAVTAGLEDSDVTISSILYAQYIPGQDPQRTKNIAAERLDLVRAKVEQSFENESVSISGRVLVRGEDRRRGVEKVGTGAIRFVVKQRENMMDGRKPRPLDDELFGKANPKDDVYNNFVNQLTEKKKREPVKK